MTGFSVEWLSMREPVDHAAINPDVRAAVIAHFSGRDDIAVVELGAGSGSGLRALAPYLPQRQTWTLLDYDPALLAHARVSLVQWADTAREDMDSVHLLRSGQEIAVHFLQADLAGGVPVTALENVDAVSASAFFDLVSARWMKDLAAQLSAHKLPLYATLTYDGAEKWSPPHPADAVMLAAFHADQHRDKGFGPAAGPDAATVLQSVFSDQGYAVAVGDSAWRLGAEEQPLITALAEGSADAVSDCGSVPPADVEAWRTARIRGSACIIGHKDVFAAPA